MSAVTWRARLAVCTRRVRSRGPALLLLFGLLTVRIDGHHSHGNYNMTEYTTLTGVVKEVHWINPHTWIYLEVKNDKGEPTIWALEGASVIQVERRGWTKDMIKVGSTIGVRCHQLRDGSSGCLLGFITLAGAAEKMFD
jgi:hypothetical protein